MRENLIVISSIGKIFVYRFNSNKKSEGPVLIFREEVGEQMVKKYGSEVRFYSKKILAIYLCFSTLKKSIDVSIDTTEIFGYEELL